MFRALQTIELAVDGRDLSLVEGEPVELTEIEGTALASGGYVERVEEHAQTELPWEQEDPRTIDSGDSGVQRPAQG